MGRGRTVFVAAFGWVVCACGDSGKAAPAPPQQQKQPPSPPVRLGNWTYFGPAQGLSNDVRDISPDEGGNVYVAGWDALYAKRSADPAFRRFDSANAGLSRRCNDAASMNADPPPTPFFQCPVVAIAGAAPGKAVVGFESMLGQAADAGGEWAHDAGGADVVTFDGEKGTMNLVRHVLTGAPPHVVCDDTHDQWVSTCATPDGWWWNNGRRLFRSVRHIAVNHDRASPMYGDAWMGGEHATLAVLLNDADRRGWVDLASQFGPNWAEARDVWEHHHPAVDYTSCDAAGCSYWQIVGQGEGISIDPRTGAPWGSNGLRTTMVSGYGGDVSYRQWGMADILDLWRDNETHPYYGPMNDRVRALSHCADGTLWIASATHGLASRDPAGRISYLHLPDDSAGAISIACDWADGSVWIGLGTGGLLRLASGRFQVVEVPGAPAFARQPVLRIQADRWSGGPRILYFAFGAARDAQGRITSPGGVGAYDGP